MYSIVAPPQSHSVTYFIAQKKSSLLFVLAASTFLHFCMMCFSSTEAFYWQLLVHPARLSLINLVDSGAVAQPTQLTRGIYSPGRKDNCINQWDAAIGRR